MGTKRQRRLGSVAVVATSLPGATGTALLLWLLQAYLQLLLHNLKKNKLHGENALFARKIPAGPLLFASAALRSRVMPQALNAGDAL